MNNLHGYVFYLKQNFELWKVLFSRFSFAFAKVEYTAMKITYTNTVLLILQHKINLINGWNWTTNNYQALQALA